MDKVKIYELAKKIDIASKDLVNKAKELGIDVNSHLISISMEQAEKLEKNLKGISNNSNKQAKEEKIKKEENKKETKPVIIRREVIISDEEEQKREDEKRKQNSRKDVGFVERKSHQDYNIVYRNKPQKPLTVSELFGLGKKEDKKEEPPKKEEIKKEVKVEEKTTDVKKEIVKEESKINVVTNVETKATTVVKENKNQVNNQNNNYKNNQNNNYKNGQNTNNYRNNQRENNFHNNTNYHGNQNNNYRNNANGYRDGNGQNRFNNRNNQNGQNKFGNGNGQRQNFNKSQRPLDSKGIDRNIKDIMSTEIVEKENQRDYNNRAIDKAKSNRYEEKNKKASRSKKGDFDEFDSGKLNKLKQEDRLSHMFTEQDGGMLDYYDLTTARGKRNKKKIQKDEERNKQKIFELKEITIPDNITVKDLAIELKKTSGEIIKKLFNYGIMATINNTVDFDTAYLVASEFGITAKKKEEIKEEDILFDDSEDKEEDLKPRPPVVVVMGHVDHGKTSLLDAIRKTNVIEGEAGGITQHIGAYKVNINGRELTFLDTPGHEAFTSMRARGAQITDIAILVVAADDGVMPQTIEAINHAKVAEIPIIVAVNKIDLPGANIDRIKQQLMEYELVPEEWGGDTIFVPISAKKHLNIENLLEMVLLVADMKELKANPNKQAKGAVIEARLDKAKGPIASMLVQRGTLNIGDTIVVGKSIGKIRAMKNDKGQKVKAAGPSTPVEIMGLTDVPEAGDTFYEVKNEKMAKHLIERRKRQAREQAINATTKVTLDNLFSQMEEGKLKVLNLIVKADVQGSVEAVKQALEKLENEEVRVKVIHSTVGAVNQSDVTLAKVSNAIIIAFNVRPDNMAKEMAEKEEVEIKQYSIIYQAIEDVEAAMKGMLDPKYEEKIIGNAEVRQTFKISNVGTIAGAYVLNGKVERNAGVRVIRDNIVIHEGHLATLKRFKDEAKEVSKGFECGMQIENYNDIKEGDIIEVFIMEEVKR